MKQSWLIAIALPLVAAVLSQWLLGCAGTLYPVQRSTPGGITIVYDDANDGRYRLPPEKVREIDERWRAVVACVPLEEQCRSSPPQVQIRGGNCDRFQQGGLWHRGQTVWNERVAVPGTLGALGHEFAHLLACEASHAKTSLPHTCGNRVDAEFRKKYPPNKCEGDR